MKIALLHPMLVSFTGGERLALRLAIELQNLGHDVRIYCYYADPKNCYPNLMKHVDVISIYGDKSSLYLSERKLYGLSQRSPTLHSILNELFTYSLFTDARRLAKSVDNGFDVLVGNNSPIEWSLYFAKRRLGLKTVWLCNEPPFWFFQKRPFRLLSYPLFQVWDKYTVKFIDRIVVLDWLNAGRVQRIYKRRAIVNRPGIDCEDYSSKGGNIFRRQLGLDDGDVLFLQVGALKEYKKQDISIEAFTALEASRRSFLLFVGDGETKTYLKSLAKQLGIYDRVIFMSNVPDSKLVDIYSACDVFLFPSEQSWGLVAVEAMAAGKPVIVSKYCGVSEIIHDGVDGFVVDTRDPAYVAKIMSRLAEDEPLRERVGKAARHLVESKLSWTVYAKKLLETLEDLKNANATS